MTKSLRTFAPLFVASICATQGIGWASPIDALTLTQLMIEDQGQETFDLVLDFGADPSSPIKFTSTVDPVAMSYNFATVSGSTYEGQALTITGNGLFNATTSVITVSSFTALGAASFTASGTTTIDLTTNPKKDTEDTKYTPNRKTKGGITYNDVHRDTTEDTDGTSTDTGFLTLDGTQIPKTMFDSENVFNTASGAWTFSQFSSDLDVGVTSVGFSPPTGGAGTFTTIAVPEPSSIALFSCNVLVALGLAMAFGRRLSPLSGCRALPIHFSVGTLFRSTTEGGCLAHTSGLRPAIKA